MATAQIGRTYAIVQNGICVSLFTKDQLPEWNESMILVVDVTAAIPTIEDNYNSSTSTFSKPTISISQAQTTQLALIDSAYQLANTQTIAYMGTTFQADDSSTTLMSKSITIMQNTGTTSCTWWDVNNVGVSMTLTQLVGLGAAIFARGQGYFAHKQTQKAAIRAATDVATVESIVW